MKILLLCGNIEGYFSLRALLAQGELICGVVISHRQWENLENQLIRCLAERYEIPVFLPDIKIEGCDLLASLHPDLILISSYPHRVPEEVLRLPPKGCINMHAAVLPQYRGKNSLVWAFIEGETRFGVTLHRVDAGIDTGDIIDQRTCEIPDPDNLNQVYVSLLAIENRMLRENLGKIKNGSFLAHPQKNGLARHWPPRKPSDSQINWHDSSRRICRFIRALAPPLPSAFSFLGTVKIEFIRCSPGEPMKEMPGVICSMTDQVMQVAAGDGSITADRFRLDDGPIIPLDELKSALVVRPGDRFTAPESK